MVTIQHLTSAELQHVWRMRNQMASAHRADKRHSKYATGIFCAYGNGAKPTLKDHWPVATRRHQQADVSRGGTEL